MSVSYCFCAFALLINRASLQERVEGIIKGSVVLPCASNKSNLNIQETDVRWKHNGSIDVFDILWNTSLMLYQELPYNNRTETFPKQYQKGNFSLTLKNLTFTDAGEYECFILHSNKLKIIQLLLNESTAAKEKLPTVKEKNGNHADECGRMRIWVLCFGCVFAVLHVHLY